MKITEPKIYLTILLIGALHGTYAQQADSLYLMSGQVVKQDGGFPVSFAHVINVDQKWGVVSDSLGFFNIWAISDDTLNVSALGYHYKEFKVENFPDTLVKIPLENRIYEIREAKISYLGTYKEFEYKVVNLKLPDLGINPGINKMVTYVDAPAVMAPSKSIMNPASFVYNIVSKQAKDIHKYFELEEEAKITDQVRGKYNEEIVKNLTGLENDKVVKFMKFCDFRNEYILSVEQYKLYSEVLLRLDEFKKIQKDSLNAE